MLVFFRDMSVAILWLREFQFCHGGSTLANNAAGHTLWRRKAQISSSRMMVDTRIINVGLNKREGRMLQVLARDPCSTVSQP